MSHTDNSRADALTDVQRESLEWLDRLCTPSMYADRLGPIRDFVKEILVASPVEQHEAAPIVPSMLTNRQVDDFAESLASLSSWHREYVAHYLKEFLASLQPAQPEPPAADERAARVADGLEACDWSGVPIGNKAIIKHAVELLRARAPRTDVAGAAEKIAALIQPNPPGELGPTDEPESQYRFGYNTAIEDALIILDGEPSVTPSADAAAAPADERAAFEQWWNDNTTWPITSKNIALHAWHARAAASQPAAAARPSDDELWDQTLRERDEYQETADKLAAAIAKHFGVDIGEHSNLNCPWDEALEVIENAAPPAQVATVPEIDPPEAGGNKGRLPALARTREGHNLYTLGYNRGLKKGHEKSAQVATRQGLTDEQIINQFYIHTVMDDEPLFAFDRRSALELARALLDGAKQ
ncbi:hypothetical protein KDW20_12015 [Burkholderia cenocepacia]|uniref:hypothetical protein n=1 Tax=Burkholderia cenocepacia TaxID=95486 RepID=UPI001B940839|nr:hypothetical protein [Burkholderia cenocepacia]MBR8376503.1 hypothetical protein [Burkholderia cenocepacia]